MFNPPPPPVQPTPPVVPPLPEAARTLWPWLVAALAAGALLTWGIIAWTGKKPTTQPILEAVRYSRDLHLVKYHYETIIPVVKGRKGDKLEFLLVAPAQVNGYIDLGKTRFKPLENKMVEISLPQPRISEPYIDLNHTQEYLTRRNTVRLFLPGSEALSKAYEDIRGAIEDSRREVAARAKANGIEAETTRRAERYFRNVFSSLGYAVQFADPIAEQPETREEARLRAELEKYLSQEPDQNRRLSLIQTLLSR